MSYDPYLVVGTGRSGTSTVAGILHNELNIFMGYKFPPPDFTNIDGFYEDVDFRRVNKDFNFGKIGYPTFEKEVARIVANRLALNKPWGFKEGRMADLLGLYLGFFENPRVIRCRRKSELVVKSLVRCYGLTEEFAEMFWFKRERTLDNVLSGKDYLTICFDERRIPDKEIISLIENKWKGENNGNNDTNQNG